MKYPNIAKILNQRGGTKKINIRKILYQNGNERKNTQIPLNQSEKMKKGPTIKEKSLL